MNESVKPTKPRREPSLLERAANVYDFHTYARVPVPDVSKAAAVDDAPVVTPVHDIPVMPEPMSDAPVAWTPPAILAPDAPMLAPPSIAFDDDAPASLSAIPAEFLAQPGDEEFLATE